MLGYLLSTFTDPNSKRSTEGLAIPALDGLRAFAAFAVVASHSLAFGMTGQGGLGVLLFFVLSGYVLALPFVHNPERIRSWKQVGKFLLNRALRIYPAFVAAVLFYAWQVGLDIGWIYGHVTLQLGWGHLWSVVQEARFYALLPFVLVVVSLLPEQARAAAVLIVAVLAWSLYKTLEVPMGNGDYFQFMFWSFLCGVAAAFIGPVTGIMATLCLWFGVGSIIGIVLLSDTVTSNFGLPSLNGWQWPVVWAFLFSALIIGIASRPDSPAVKFFASPILRHLGLISYGIYLWHQGAIIFLLYRGWDYGTSMFIVATAITYVAATASYLVLEKPFMMMKSKRTKSNVVVRTPLAPSTMPS